MWVWMKRFVSMDTSELLDLRKENREMRLLLARALKVSQELSLRQQESLDRVIVAKFDLPVIASPISEQPTNKYTMPMEHMADLLATEDDRDFLERVHGA